MLENVLTTAGRRTTVSTAGLPRAGAVLDVAPAGTTVAAAA